MKITHLSQSPLRDRQPALEFVEPWKTSTFVNIAEIRQSTVDQRVLCICQSYSQKKHNKMRQDKTEFFTLEKDQLLPLPSPD